MLNLSRPMLVSLLLTASASAQVHLQFSGPDSLVGLEIRHPELRAPFRIAAGEPGGLFFETDSGRYRVAGTPVERIEREDGLLVRWRLYGRQVELRAFLEDSAWVIALKALPDADLRGWGLSVELDPGEFLTGLMERVVDGPQNESWRPGMTEAMNLRGQVVTMVVKPTLSLYAPFLLSSRGYGLWVNSTWPGIYDLGKSHAQRLQIVQEGPELRLKLYPGWPLIEVVRRFSREVGPTFLPPRWAFRPWRWRDEHQHRERYYDGTPVRAPYNSKVVEDILMMQALDIPCGVYWVDRPWAVGPYGYDDFEWDRRRLPQPERMIRWLEKKGIRFLLWIAPWVQGDMAREALFRGFRLPGQQTRQRERVLIDFTNPAARRWWQDSGPRRVMEAGVRGFKLDRSEELVPMDRDILVYDGRSARENRNDYPRQYLQATYEIARRLHGDDFVLMPRAGFVGSARYGIFWGGDIHGTEYGLRAAIIAAQRAALIGFPIWGSDTGGYWGGFNREVTARWLAFSAFTPLMEVGPTDNRAFWDMPEAPHYDEELIAIWRLYAVLHDRLADYTYRQAVHARDTGMPIVRPLFAVFPRRARSLG